jgi:hypothetical protein
MSKINSIITFDKKNDIKKNIIYEYNGHGRVEKLL